MKNGHGKDTQLGKQATFASDKDIPLQGMHKEMWEELKGRFGLGNAIKVDTLAQQFGVDSKRVRMIVRSLIVDYGKPVCASIAGTKGYFIPVTNEEREMYCNNLKARIRGISERLLAVDRNTAKIILETLNK